MFKKCDGKWVNLISDAVVTYNRNKHTTIILISVDASNNSE